MPPATLHELLRSRAREWPDRVAYVFESDAAGGREVTFAELHQHALDVSELLRERGAAGKRVLLAHADGFEYAVGFFGCLEAGAVAVSCYAPERARAQATTARVRRLAEATGSSLVLAGRTEIDAARGSGEDGKLTWIDAGTSPRDARAADHSPGNPDDVAYIQTTSGSTGEMKGVELTHRCLTANLELQRELLPTSESSVFVIWLALAHDMGFVAPLLQPLWVGCRSVFIPPLSFVVKPVRWLDAITRHGGTIAGGPNFGFDLAASRVTFDQRERLDLESWTCAANGAEPIRADTLERFERAFAPVGFRRRSWAPVYGLAEMTSTVTCSRRDDGPIVRHISREALGTGEVVEAREQGTSTMTLVGCGRPAAHHRVVVVDPETREPAPPNGVGEIWLAGPSMARGYFGDPVDSTDQFGAELATGEGPFLRTGDLGFQLDDELYVCGRLKEVILVRGRNHAPHDIEATVASSHPRLASGVGVAFGVDTGEGEQLVVMHELADPAADGVAEVTSAVRSAVVADHGISPETVVLLEPGALPRTGSGKVRRGPSRTAFEESDLARVITIDSRKAEASIGTDAG